MKDDREDKNKKIKSLFIFLNAPTNFYSKYHDRRAQMLQNKSIFIHTCERTIKNLLFNNS